MNWVVTGSQGQLGRALSQVLGESPGDSLVAAPSHAELDIGDRDAVLRYLAALDPVPTVVANAAAYTHVDRCETERDVAERVNARAPGYLAEACREIGARFLHISTDYVFPGNASEPYREDDPTGPRSAYGSTKLEGEERALETAPDSLVVRTSWVFGEGRNFIGAILGQVGLRRRGEASGPLRVVADQEGRPTYAVDLARGLLALSSMDVTGRLHLANRGVATWWDLARFCVDEAGEKELEIERLDSGSLDVAAPRPAYSVLDLRRAEALGLILPDWRDAVRAYLATPNSPLAALAAESPS